MENVLLEKDKEQNNEKFEVNPFFLASLRHDQSVVRWEVIIFQHGTIYYPIQTHMYKYEFWLRYKENSASNFLFI